MEYREATLALCDMGIFDIADFPKHPRGEWCCLLFYIAHKAQPLLPLSLPDSTPTPSLCTLDSTVSLTECIS